MKVHLKDLLGMAGKGSLWMSTLPMHIMAAGKNEKNYEFKPDRSAWTEEKDDILERANWLCENIIRDPEELVSAMPEVIGREYQGQWAIYCCSMLTHALANISVLYPETKQKCVGLIEKLIKMVDTPTMREYDTMKWREDAMKTLAGSKSHMTYLSILSWMITNYKLIGGDGRFDQQLHGCCEALNRRMLQSKYDMNLLSFPYTPIFMPDMLVPIVALHNYGRLFDGKYDDTVKRWLHNAKTKWIHRRTGLLAGKLPGASRKLKYMQVLGSYTALNCSYLSLVDPEFAREQHELMKKALWKEDTVLGTRMAGIKEYLTRDPKFSLQSGDAGIVLYGISAGGCAFALGSATYLGDWKTRYELLRTAEIAGGTKQEARKRHYKLGEMFMVGEATALAMRTNIPR
jgi:hypothetical protein